MRKTVFLSSTGADLSAWRAQVIEDARGYDWFLLDAMEEWSTRDESAIPFCRARVQVGARVCRLDRNPSRLGAERRQQAALYHRDGIRLGKRC